MLVLREVLGFRAAEVAEMLDSTEPSVNSALKRARSAFETRLPAGDRDRAPLPRSARERELVGRFADAFEGGDVDGIVALLTDDAWLDDAAGPARVPGSGGDRAVSCRPYPPAATLSRFRLVATRANGQPAFGRLPQGSTLPDRARHGDAWC